VTRDASYYTITNQYKHYIALSDFLCMQQIRTAEVTEYYMIKPYTYLHNYN